MSAHALLSLAVNRKSERKVDSLPPLGFEPAIFDTLAGRAAKSHPFFFWFGYCFTPTDTEAYLRGGWSHYTDTSEPFDGGVGTLQL
jgi:hypothetical protein